MGQNKQERKKEPRKKYKKDIQTQRHTLTIQKSHKKINSETKIYKQKTYKF